MRKNSLSYKTALFINIALTTAIFILNYFYQYHNFNYTLKCICSSGFAVIGVTNLLYATNKTDESKSYYYIMTLGLILAMLGDIAINPNFIIGAALFSLGHICFVLAYCIDSPIHKLDIIFCFVAAVGSELFMCLYPDFSFEIPLFKWICIFYALLISIMLGKAASNYIRKRNYCNTLLAVGSILFYFSDLKLLLDWFVGKWEWTSKACMAAYYPALCFMAISLLLKAEKK